MKTVPVSKFRAQCFALINEVHATREHVLITKRGKPFVRLVPAGKPAKFIGRLKGKIKIVGDILSPIVPPEAWEYD
jgi:prevent-host-death family protein